jgi:RNA polymerase sigma-54 factor
MEQRLLAQMLPSLTILEMPSLDLVAYLREAFESNEALTFSEPRAHRSGLNHQASDRHSEWLAAQPAREHNLKERLNHELGLRDIKGPEARELVAWTEFLIGELDDQGLLTASDDDLLEGAKRAGLAASEPEEMLLAALDLLRAIAPEGVGARSSIEALLWQLDPNDDDFAVLTRLLGDFLEELGANKWPKVAGALGINLDELDRLVARVAELQLNWNASEAHDAPAAPAIVPEVLVEEDPEHPGHFTVQVDGAAWPEVGLDEDLEALVGDPDVESSVRKYLRGKLDDARQLVTAVEQRRTTLLRVARALFAHQRAFLEHGPGHLLPLRQDDVANLIGVHRSTISRAIAGKYAWTPWGLFALRHFFQSAAGASEQSAREDVRAVLARVVGSENPTQPYSDEELVEQMAARGFRLARRTIAKYRGELSIKSSYLRRRFVA